MYKRVCKVSNLPCTSRRRHRPGRTTEIQTEKLEGYLKNRKGAANGQIGKVPPEKLEPDAQGASGHNDEYMKDNNTIHVQKTLVGEAV